MALEFVMAVSNPVAPAMNSAAHAKARLGLIAGVPIGSDRQGLQMGQQVTELQVIEQRHPHSIQAPPPPSSGQKLALRATAVTHAIGRPVRASQNALVGAALVIVDAVPKTLAPVGFTLRHLPTLFLAALILAGPALGAALLWSVVPGWRENFPLDHLLSVRGLFSMGFLAGLYVALGFVAVVIGVLLRGVGRGVAGSTKALASRGETAFEEDEMLI